MGTDGGNNVQVAVRIRPQNSRETAQLANICTIVTPDEPQITMGDKSFTFDFVFDQFATQPYLYDMCVKRLVEGTFHGFNATVLAYGQTGSGKTYTMGTNFDNSEFHDEAGMIPRAAHQLFDSIKEIKETAISEGKSPPSFELSIQFVEIYNEEIIDLMTYDRSRQIKIREDPIKNEISLNGISSTQVNSADDILDSLRNGALNRKTAMTSMNEQSSRSHAIFTVVVNQKRFVSAEDNDENIDSADVENISAKFHFVDLGGSERLKRTGATGDRAKEGININSGLLALGNVISALGCPTGRQTHVPYRDSKLTRILQDSLGGNSRTLMIACVSPTTVDSVETLNTLNYANRAKNIKNKVVANQKRTSIKLQNAVAMRNNYPKQEIDKWHLELELLNPPESKRMKLLAPMPEYKLTKPDDVDVANNFSEFLKTRVAKYRGYLETANENALLFESKLKERLCLADLDRKRILELESENHELKTTNKQLKSENLRLKRKNNAQLQRILLLENAAEINHERGEKQTYLEQERLAALTSSRRTMQEMAKLFASPVPTTSNVSRLRTKFVGESKTTLLDNNTKESESDE